MENEEKLALTSSLHTGKQQLVITTQLVRASMNMHHIDEMLTWLANMIVQNLHVQVMQFWANQASSTDQTFVILRTTVCQDTSLPQSIVVNAHVAQVIARLISEQHSATLQPVNSAFSLHQANLFRRYGLNYWFSCFLTSDALLPPPVSDNFFAGNIATPLAMVAVLFWRQLPPQNLVTSALYILEQAVATAKRRGLLLAPVTNVAIQAMRSVNSEQQHPLPPLAELIPQRIRDTEAMRSRSPFTGAVIIPESEARRLYLAIDGRKTVAELAYTTQLSMKDIYAALNVLLTKKHIQLCDQANQPIDGLSFLNNKQ